MNFITERVFFLPDAFVIGNGDGIGCLFSIGDDGSIELFGDDVACLFFGQVGFVEGQGIGFFGEFVCCLTQLFAGSEADPVYDVLIEMAEDSVIFLQVFQDENDQKRTLEIDQEFDVFWLDGKGAISLHDQPYGCSDVVLEIFDLLFEEFIAFHDLMYGEFH